MFRLLEKISFSDYTLIIPSVSVGNVGQLTNDLLISVFNLKLVGTVYHKAIIPAVGPNPYDPTADICVACELYACQKNKVAILQLRTSIEQKFADEFFEEFKAYISLEKFKQVIILTSTYAHEMHNINTSQYRYITNQNTDIFEKLNILPMEVSRNGSYVIYGGGFAFKLYNKLKEIATTFVLIKYTSEGDNRPDAYSMFTVVNEIIGITQPKEMKQPYSWNLVYGGPPPIGIF